MSPVTKAVVTEAAANALAEVLAAQPWWKRYAGTITTAAGALATFLGPLAAADLGLPKAAQVIIGVLAAVAAVLAARATKNGQTPRTGQATIDAIIPSVIDAITPPASTLDDLVRGEADRAARTAERIATEAATKAITGGGPGGIVGGAVGSAEAFLDMLKRGVSR